MLKVTIPSSELFDDKKSEFINVKEHTIQLEHSLVSLSKWESRWCKPFLNKKEKTTEEVIDYIKCMTITQNCDENIYKCIPNKVIKQIQDYIEADMTATTFPKTNNTGSREIITSEIIYYWMITFNIPFDCQKWHLNRLLALIEVCNIKNAPKKKMSQSELMARNAQLNAERKARLNTKG